MSWSRRLQAFWQLRFGGLIPLSTAAKLAYEEARAQKTIWAVAAERLPLCKTPEGILDYCAAYIGMNVPIWGARPPSEHLEQIPKSMAKNGSMSGGAKRLTYVDNANTEFVDLQVHAKDVRTIIKLMAQKAFADGNM